MFTLARLPLKCSQAQRLSASFLSRSLSTSYRHILVETKGKNNEVALVTLNRPKALNALCADLMNEIGITLGEIQNDSSIGSVVLTGSMKAFAAGADIKEMRNNKFAECFVNNFLCNWDSIAKFRKPIIAAVNGYALGGGCEVAMMCDIIYAGEGAKFGQPEISIGVIPGAGGTQRLTKLVGKSRAMEIVLSGLPINAKEAYEWGLVSRVFPDDKVVDEAVKLAEVIASKSKLTAAVCKESVNNSFETPLQQGLLSEKRLFHSLFGTNDQVEGMAAFVDKRPPKFSDS